MVYISMFEKVDKHLNQKWHVIIFSFSLRRIGTDPTEWMEFAKG